MATPRHAGWFAPTAEVYSAQEYEAMAKKFSEAIQLIRDLENDGDFDWYRAEVKKQVADWLAANTK